MTHRDRQSRQMSASEANKPPSVAHAASATLEESHGHTQAMIRLAECGDTLRIARLAAVLGISVRTIQDQERDGTFPIPRVGGLGRGRKYRRRLYAKADVVRFLEQGGHLVFRARRHSRRIA